MGRNKSTHAAGLDLGPQPRALGPSWALLDELRLADSCRFSVVLRCFLLLLLRTDLLEKNTCLKRQCSIGFKTKLDLLTTTLHLNFYHFHSPQAPTTIKSTFQPQATPILEPSKSSALASQDFGVCRGVVEGCKDYGDCMAFWLTVRSLIRANSSKQAPGLLCLPSSSCLRSLGPALKALNYGPRWRRCKIRLLLTTAQPTWQVQGLKFESRKFESPNGLKNGCQEMCQLRLQIELIGSSPLYAHHIFLDQPGDPGVKNSNSASSKLIILGRVNFRLMRWLPDWMHPKLKVESPEGLTSGFSDDGREQQTNQNHCKHSVSRQAIGVTSTRR